MTEFTGRPGEILERLNRLYPALIDLSLDRLQALLARLGHPENKLPPVIHVAGTNGKGSTCATLRALGEAALARACHDIAASGGCDGALPYCGATGQRG